MNTMSEKAAAWRAGAPPALATVRSPAIPTGDPRVSTEAIKAYYGQFSTDQLGFLLTNLRNFFRSENLTDVQLLFRYYISELEKRRPAASSEQTPEVLEELDNFEETETESTFSEYQPRKYIGGLPHPDPLVESSSLSAVEPPDITYTLTLPLEVASRGLLSRAQLEGVTYACQAHEQLLQTGERKGYFIGDGAGVGKGRQLAALLLQNQLLGRKKHIWLSVSADLRVDSKRDLEDIGAAHLKTFNLADFDYSPLRLASGIMYTTYSSLIAANRSGRKSKTRLDQLIAWCGEDFEGCLLFDECHKAKNLGMLSKSSSKTGIAVYNLQKMLPNARIVYCSATGITAPADMAYMTRLGLWGPGTSFPSGFNEFLGIVDRGGLGMMELVAMHLKRSGVYHCRALSLKGTDFEIVENDVSESELNMYNMAADLWQLLFFELVRVRDIALGPPLEGESVRTEDDLKELKNEIKKGMMYFWSAHQRFFRSLCISLKVKRAIQMTKTLVDNGKSVIIGLQGTGEASLNEAVKNNVGLEDFISAPKRTLLNTIERLYEISSLVAGKSGIRHKKIGGKKRSSLINSDLESSFESESGISDFIAESDEDDAGGNSAEIVCRRGALIRLSASNINPAEKNSVLEDDIWSDDTTTDANINEIKVDENENAVLRGQGLNAIATPQLSAKLMRTMRKEGWIFDNSLAADSWISKRCRKFFNGNPIDGTIIAFLPASENEGLPLWHLLHDDGDSEDLDEDEVLKYVKYYEKQYNRITDIADKCGISDEADLSSTQTEGSSEEDEEVVPPLQKTLRPLGIESRQASLPIVQLAQNTGSVTISYPAVNSSSTMMRNPTFVNAMASMGWIFADDEALDARLKKKLFGSSDRVACFPGAINNGATLWLFDERSSESCDSREMNKLSSDLKAFYDKKAVTVLFSSMIDNEVSAFHSLEGENSTQIGSSRKRPLVIESETDDDESVSAQNIGGKPAGCKIARTEGHNAGTEPNKSVKSFNSFGELVPKVEIEIEKKISTYDAFERHQTICADLTIMNCTASMSEGFEYRFKLLRSLAENINPPGNPLDTLLNDLGGADAVAEMTGRKGRMLKNSKTGKVSYHKRTENGNKLDMQNIYEREQFQKGKKRIAIISEAASAGISLQADRRKLNQDRRVHITIELPWSADRAIQQLGRSHRSNQSSAPEYKILVTRFGGENRFASAVAKKMISLGAMTHGDRRSTVDTKHFNLAHFDFDSKYGKSALDEIMEKIRRREKFSGFPNLDEATERATVRLIDETPHLQLKFLNIYGIPARQAGTFAHFLEIRSEGPILHFSEAAMAWLFLVGIDVADGDNISVAKFFNRILGLQFDRQNTLFQVFTTHLSDIVRQAKRNGTFDLGILEIKGRRLGAVVEACTPVEIYTDHPARDLSLLHDIQCDKGVLWDESEQILIDALTEFKTIKGNLEEEKSNNSGLTRYFLYTTKGKKIFYVFGYYEAIEGFGGKHHCLLALEKISFVQDFLPTNVTIFRPRTGRQEMTRSKLNEKYRLIPADEAEVSTLMCETFNYFDMCFLRQKRWNRNLADEHMGARLSKMKIISGSVLPIWPIIDDSLRAQQKGNMQSGFMKAPRIKIVRACLSKVNEPSSGEDVENYKSIIGVLVAPYTTSDMFIAAINQYKVNQRAASAIRIQQNDADQKILIESGQNLQSKPVPVAQLFSKANK